MKQTINAADEFLRKNVITILQYYVTIKLSRILLNTSFRIRIMFSFSLHFSGLIQRKCNLFFHITRTLYVYLQFTFPNVCEPVARINSRLYFEMAQRSLSKSTITRRTTTKTHEGGITLLPSCCSLCFESALKSHHYNSSILQHSGAGWGWESRANLQWQRGSDQPVLCLFPLAVPCSSRALNWDQSSQLGLTDVTPGSCRKGWSWISSRGLILWKNTDIELFSQPASWVASLKSWLRDQWRRRSIWEVGQVACHSDWVSTCPQWGLSGGNYVVTATPQFVSVLEERADMPPLTHTPCLWHWFSFWGAVDM